MTKTFVVNCYSYNLAKKCMRQITETIILLFKLTVNKINNSVKQLDMKLLITLSKALRKMLKTIASDTSKTHHKFH